MRQEMASWKRSARIIGALFLVKRTSPICTIAPPSSIPSSTRAASNWTLMFMDLEHLLPDGVRVISIEPKQVPGHVEVKLSVGVTSDEAELKFERALEESKEFTEVQVQSVHMANPSGNQSGDQKVVQLTHGLFENLMRRDFTLRKRTILGGVILLVLAECPLLPTVGGFLPPPARHESSL